MAKKNKTSAKKKVKTDKSKDDSIWGEINTKLKSSQKSLQKEVDELRSQVKSLSKASGKSARKLIKNAEKNYHKKLTKLQNEFDKRMKSVHKLQDNVIAKLPADLVETLHLKTNNSVKPTKTTSKAKGKVKKPVTSKATSKIVKPTSVEPTAAKTAKPKTVKPTTAAKTSKPKTAPKAPTIASIKGVGPVIQKKLAEAGFTSLEDLANTPQSKVNALKQFEKTRGFNTWKPKAQALLDNK